MDTLTNDRAIMGGNNPPPYDPDKLADLSGSVDEWMRASTDIRAKHNPISSESEAQLLTDHIGGLRGLAKKVDAARVEAKKPHDEAAKAVQAAFTPLTDRIKRALDAMLAMQGDWLTRKNEEERRRKAEEQRLADAARAEAERAAREAAASGDLDAEVEAERKRKEAEDLEKLAARETKVNAGSATGAGRTVALVEVREAELVNIAQLFLHFRDHPKVSELLLSLANAELRSKDWNGKDIPGTRTRIEKRAR